MKPFGNCFGLYPISSLVCNESTYHIQYVNIFIVVYYLFFTSNYGVQKQFSCAFKKKVWTEIWGGKW